MKSVRITVVMPSYNQVEFVERAVLSVLEQKYHELEYFVVDGGSGDGTLEVLGRYASRFTWWVSEPDNGQSAAINKGFARSTGDVLCWLNSDDAHRPGTLAFVADYFEKHSEVDVLCGSVQAVDPNGYVVHTGVGRYVGRSALASYWLGYDMHQPSIFWRRRVYEAIGPLREGAHLTMDFDYWLRMSEQWTIRSVDQVLSTATIHTAQKTSNYDDYRRAQFWTVLRHFGNPFAMRDWGVRASVYKHAAAVAVRAVFLREPFRG